MRLDPSSWPKDPIKPIPVGCKAGVWRGERRGQIAALKCWYQQKHNHLQSANVWCSLVSPWILNGINISNVNYPPTSSLVSCRHTWLWKCVFRKCQECRLGAEFQLCRGHLSYCPAVAEGSVPDTTKSPQPLLLADQKHISSSRGKWMWRPGRAGSPHKLLTFWPLTPASECCGSCSPRIALGPGWWILQTILLKHGVDPCTDVNIWLCCVGSLRSKHLHVLVCVSRLNGE